VVKTFESGSDDCCINGLEFAKDMSEIRPPSLTE
jgi:hypothetical protein